LGARGMIHRVESEQGARPPAPKKKNFSLEWHVLVNLSGNFEKHGGQFALASPALNARISSPCPHP